MLELDGKIVNVCGLKYTIKMVDKIHRCEPIETCDVCGEDSMDTFGVITEKNMTIQLKNGIDDQQLLRTLFHEIIHGYLFMWTDYKKMEPEYICEFGSNIIVCLLQDNPWIVGLFLTEPSIVALEPKYYDIAKAEVLKNKQWIGVSGPNSPKINMDGRL